jgi:elongation factor 2
MNYKKEEVARLLERLNIELKPEDRDKDGKALLKVTVGSELKFVPAHLGIFVCQF